MPASAIRLQGNKHGRLEVPDEVEHQLTGVAGRLAITKPCVTVALKNPFDRCPPLT